MRRSSSPWLSGIIAALSVAASALPAQARYPGSTSALFLALGSGARPAGMGEAFAATANDSNSVLWNPAGLAALDGKMDIGLNYLSYFEKINYGSIRAAFQIPKKGEVLGVAGINLFFLSGGNLKATDVNGNDTGQFNPIFAAGQIAFGRQSSTWQTWAFGGAIKFAYETMNGVSAMTGALDLGAQWQTPVRRLVAALVLQNLGPSIAGPDPLPQTIRFGMAYKIVTMQRQRISLECDLVELWRQEFPPQAHLGVEYAYEQTYFVRGGYVFRFPGQDLGLNAGIRAGVGLKLWKHLKIDYAYQGSGTLYSDPHRFDLSYDY